LLVRIIFGLPLEPLPGWLGWGENLRRWRIRYQFGVRLSDVRCPFRLYRREILARIPIQSQGPFVHVEILAKANFLGCLMTEVPLHEYTEPASIKSVEAEQQWRKARRQVFSHPDLGPAKIIDP